MKSSAIISILILLIINKTIESASVHRRNGGGGGGGGGIKNNSTMKPFRWILDKPQCLERQRMAQVDLYIERMIGFGRRGRPFPENGAQLKPYCNETRVMVKYIDEYLHECYERDIQKLANIVLYTLKRNIRYFCNKKPTNKKLKNLLKLAGCLNTRIKDDDCIVGMMNSTSALIPSGISSKEKIKYVCCYYAELVRCGDEWMDTIPCIHNDKEIALDFLRGLSSDIISVACSDYNEFTNRCDHLKPLELKQHQLAKRKKYGSILNIMIDTIESMDGFL
ncbi:uncharacterized protein LOC124495421 [Dermatophagoides farinae]|uniref:Uncharacterized protein n=1 Tax=Dermatophagoides farinae TaxID=6954 RepID=A0A922L7U6_DERFA|nr:hypothetical protein HUG17_8367 [Dermatophagoides farinae]KAH9526511.1 hypothetical protein DERF_000593 [Dermatophagoides farinae]